jgi:hypothetical protein
MLGKQTFDLPISAEGWFSGTSPSRYGHGHYVVAPANGLGHHDQYTILDRVSDPRPGLE